MCRNFSKEGGKKIWVTQNRAQKLLKGQMKPWKRLTLKKTKPENAKIFQKIPNMFLNAKFLECQQLPILFLPKLSYHRSIYLIQVGCSSSTISKTRWTDRYKASKSLLFTNEPSIDKKKEHLLTKLTQFNFISLCLASTK